MSLPVAANLVGTSLDGGWTVTQPFARGPDATGGAFSFGYNVVHRDGRIGFLKALDFSDALRSEDPARALEVLTTRFNFERDLLDLCAASNMDHVVRAVAHGTARVDGEVVQYIIFELADSDIRARLSIGSNADLYFTLTTLHHVAIGMSQLHRKRIAHQDLKPSNVLVFGGEPGRSSTRRHPTMKVGDLGRASLGTTTSPFDELTFAGDYTYAPPEALYGHTDSDWRTRRIASDLYQLGSIVSFLFAGMGMTAVIQFCTRQEHMPEAWKGTYADVLPYVEDAFAKAVELVSNESPGPLRSALSEAVQQLCAPNPARRGHPLNHRGAGDRLALDRYVSLFNRWAKQAELGLIA